MKKILKFIGKYKIFLVLSVLLATVSVILQLYVPILFGDAIDQIVAEHPGADFILEIGSHVKIKRVLFERFLDAASCV